MLTTADILPAERTFRPAPLLPWAVGLAAGIWADDRFELPLAMGVVAVATGAVLLLIRTIGYRDATICALLVAAGAGALLHRRAVRIITDDHIVRYCSSDGSPARLVGVVVDRPRIYRRGFEPFEPWLFEQDRTAFVLDVQGVQTRRGMERASGSVRVVVKQAALAIQQGDRVEVFGWMFRPGPPRNPAQFDWSRRSARQGVLVSLVCDSGRNIRSLPQDSARFASRFASLRRYVRRLLLDERIKLGEPNTSLLDAMILGRRAGIDRKLERAFLETGCAHFLAVSGFHVGVLAATIWFFLRWFPISGRAAGILTIAAVVAYAFIADPRPPIIRAAVMASALGICLILNRPLSAPNALCLAAILILLVEPAALFDAGFQLSFEAVASILLAGPLVIELLRRAGKKITATISGRRPVSSEIEAIQARHQSPSYLRWFSVRMLEILGISITAWLGSLPIVAAHFNQVAPWGWLASFVALPLVVVVVVLGFAKLLLALLFPVLAGGVDAMIDPASHLLMSVMNGMQDTLGGRISISQPPWWVILTYFGGILGATILVRRGCGRRTVATCLAIPILFIGAWQMAPNGHGELILTQFAVGRGTSTVIEFPDGDVWIYDIGASGPLDPGATIVAPYLLSRNITRINGVIISHANLDHFSGLPSLLDSFACDRIYLTPGFAGGARDHSPVSALLDSIEKHATPVAAIDASSTLDTGAVVKTELLWPPPNPPPALSVNDQSIVLSISYRGFRILLTGDIGYEPQEYLMDHIDLECDALVLPHHGAIVGNTARFVAATDATHLLRSSNIRNQNSPKWAPIAAGRRLHNTADCGAIQIIISDDGMSVRRFLE